MSEFTYKILKSTWGINITLEAIWEHLSEYNGNPIQISEKLFLADETNYITKGQAYFLYLGLETMSAEFDESFKDKEPIVIILKEVSYVPCDYQDEGLACAIIGWISQEFAISIPIVNVTFDKEKNHYDFRFPKNDYLLASK